MDDITYLCYEGCLPPGVYGDRHNILIETYHKCQGKTYIPSTVHKALHWSRVDPFLEPVSEEEWHIVKKSRSDKQKLDRIDEAEQPPAKKIKSDSNGLYDNMDIDAFRGPAWNNNSCAFDAVMAILYNIWTSDPELWTEIFEEINPQYLRHHLVTTFLASNSESALNEAQDAIRRALINDFSNIFVMGMKNITSRNSHPITGDMLYSVLP